MHLLKTVDFNVLCLLVLGGVYYVNEDGKCMQCFSVDYSVKTLLYYREKDILVTITDNLMLTQHNVLPEGDVSEILKVSRALNVRQM